MGVALGRKPYGLLVRNEKGEGISFIDSLTFLSYAHFGQIPE